MGKGGRRRGRGGKRNNGLCGLKDKPTSENYPNQWTTGLFDCFHDVPVCLEGSFFPCCQQGLLWTEIMKPTEEKTAWSWCGGGSCVYAFVMSIYAGLGTSITAYTLRTNILYRYSIGETPGVTCGAGCFCCLCANCQSIRELKARGHDPGGVFPCLCRYNTVEHDEAFYRKYPSAPPTRSMIEPGGRCSVTNHTPKDNSSNNTNSQNTTAHSEGLLSSSGQEQEMIGTGDDVAPPSNGYDFQPFPSPMNPHARVTNDAEYSGIHNL